MTDLEFMKIVTTKSTDGILSEAENAKGIIVHVHSMSGTPIQETYYETMYAVRFSQF